MTPEQIRQQIEKRLRDGVVRGERHRLAEAARAAQDAQPLPPRTPAARAAQLLNLGPPRRYPTNEQHQARARALDEIAGRRLTGAECAALDVIVQRAAGRLLLAPFDGAGVDQLWTIKDGSDRVITTWIYRKGGGVLSARVTGPRRTRRRSKAPGWPLFIAELLADAAGRVVKCRGCGAWYGRTHGRQSACSPRCARLARRRVVKT